MLKLNKMCKIEQALNLYNSWQNNILHQMRKTKGELKKIQNRKQKNNLPDPKNLRRIDRVRLKEKAKLVDEVLDSVQTSNITEDNQLVKCGAFVITQLLGIKEIRNKKKEEPFWKRRIRDRNFEKGKSED